MTTDAQTISYQPAIVHFTDLVQGDTLSFMVNLTDDESMVEVSCRLD